MAAPVLADHEVPRTLAEAPAPKLLGLADQVVLWGNLGVSLLLPVTAPFLFAPGPGPALSLGAVVAALVIGSVIGNVMLGIGAVPGAQTGAPSMVLLRGLLGWRGSWVPTAVNVVQLIGWTTFEIVVIADAAAALTTGSLRWLFAVLAGAAGTAMALWPMLAVRGYLKRVAVWVVLASTVYLFVQVLRRPLPGWGDGSWSGFWRSADLVIALSVSWIPLASDYSRHSRSGRAAFGGAALGNGIASAAFFLLGVFVYASAGTADVDVLGRLLAIPAGSIALLILAVDEVDEVFANLYSAVVSSQNAAPRVDRRVITLAIGALATILALVLDIEQYQSFLLLIGSVFVPLFATFAADYFLVRRGNWDTSERAEPRLRMLLPWAAGFVAYQLVNPGSVSWWTHLWTRHGEPLVSGSWASASLLSFAVAAVATVAVGRGLRRT